MRRGSQRNKRPVEEEEEVPSVVEPAKKRPARRRSGRRGNEDASRDADESASQAGTEGWERDSTPGLEGNALTQSMFEDSECMISPLEDFDEEDDEVDTDTEVEDEGDQRTKSRIEAADELLKTRRGNKRPRRKNNELVSSSDGSTTVDEDEENSQKKGRKARKKKRSDSKKKTPRCCSPVWSALTAKEKEKSEGLKSGTIKSLRMFNFMCHESFYQEWHPNINFIIGENGSGKSALLSGMLIGLGAKATATSRSRTTTDLIMKGKDCARTQVVLTNKGHLSVTKYGREFMLERTISKTGSSVYRIRAEGHTWRPLKRNELDYILMVLNIQLDNPVAILNQEVAKNFLRTKDPKDKYELFYMGTLLRQLFGLLDDSRTHINVAENNLEIHKKVIDELRSTVKKLKNKLQEFENLRKLSDKISSLEAEYLWALVIDEESKQKSLTEKLANLDSCKMQFEANIADMQSKMRKTVEDKDLAEQASALKIRLDEMEKQKDSIRHDRHAKIVQQNQLKGQIRSVQTEITGKKGEIAVVEKTLSHVLSVSEEDEERFMREYEAKKLELQEKKSQTLQTINTLRNDGEQFKNGADAVGERLINIENENATLLRDIEMKNRLVSSMEGPNRNKYTAYGDNMENLMRKIEANANKFRKPPRGPIGACITVKNPKFTKLIEDVMMTKDLPFSFIVDNPDDLRLFQRLVNEAYGSSHKFRPSVFSNIFATTAHDVQNVEARISGVPTLLDMIEVENNDPVVFNALLDYLGAEKILLFESNDDAARVMKDRSIVPPSCVCGYTLEWFRFTPLPNFAAKVMKKLGAFNFIHSSKTDQKRVLQRDLKQLKLQLESIRPELEATKKEKSNLLMQWTERKNELEKKKRELAKIEKDVNLNESNKYQAPDVASHREELQSVQEALAELEEKKEQISQQLDNLHGEVQFLGEQTRELEIEIPKILSKMNSVDSEKDNNAKKIEKFRQVIAKIQSKINGLETQRAPVLAQLDHCQVELNRKMDQANNDTQQRVETTRTSDDVKKEFELIKRQRSEMEKHLGNQRKLQKEYEKYNEEFDDKCKEYDPLHKSFVSLRDLVDGQLLFLFKKRAEISMNLSVTYTALAQQRGYKGQMLIDHDTKELHFFICPDQSSSNKTDSAVRDSGKQSQKSLIEYSLGLSGGERSFSTICFILSLWQIMECPFYMLDEFDVYMDALNRKASQNALLTHAKAFTSNQFFLYTPLELSEVPEKEDALTLRLRPARPTEDIPNPRSPVTDNETENVNPQSRAATSKGRKGGRGRNAAAMSEKNRVSAEQ